MCVCAHAQVSLCVACMWAAEARPSLRKAGRYGSPRRLPRGVAGALGLSPGFI